MSEFLTAETPAQRRADSASRAPDGAVVSSGVASLRQALSGHASAFADWRRQPVTRAVLRALQGFLMHPPAELMPRDTLVQYGLTQGVILAVQLLTDPSVLWPDIFGDQAGAAGRLPEMDFETSLDEVLK